MKEIKMSQEIFLFQDAVRSASFGGLDFFSEEIIMIDKASQVVLDILRDVKEMSIMDGKCVIEIEENLHRLLMNKTLVSSEGFKDEERKQFYSHACDSFPSVGWGVYVRSILICNWTSYAINCWDEDPLSTRLFTYENILSTINESTNLEHFHLFYLVTTKVFDLLTESDCSIDRIWNEVLQRVVHYLEKRIFSEQSLTESSNFLIKLFTHFCLRLKNRLNILDFDAVKRFFQSMTAFTVLTVERLPENNKFKTNLMSCSLAVNALASEDKTNSLQNLRALQTSLNKYANSKYENEEERMKDISSVDSQKELSENSSILRLLENLKLSPPEKILDCFLRNYKLLQPKHLQLIVESKQMYTDTTTVSSIDRIVERAFKNWSLETQDKFRQDINQSAAESNIDERLTKVFNVLSSSTSESKKLNVIMIELSYLCLVNPQTTLSGLMSFAVESGQSALVVKILSHFTDASSLSILTEVLQQLIHKNMTFQEFEHFLQLIREMVRNMKVNPLVELLIRNMQFNDDCSKVLIILMEIIEGSSEEDVNSVFEKVKLSVFYLQLGKLLHHCMVANLKESSINVLIIRQHVLELLKCLREKCISFGHSKHELCWLYSRLQQLHPTIIFHFIEIFSSSEDEKRLLINVKSMSLSHILIVGFCCSDKNEKFWEKCLDRARKSNLKYETLCCPIARILIRLTESELERLPNVIAPLFSFCQLNELSQPLIVLQILTDAILLLRHSSSKAKESYFQRASANCSKLMNGILKCWQPKESFLWISVVGLIGSLIEPSDSSSKCFQFLLVDLLSTKSKEFDSTCTKIIFEMVERLNNVELTSNASKLLQIN